MMKLANLFPDTDPPHLNIFSFGHNVLIPEHIRMYNSIYVDVRELKSVKVGIDNNGTDIATMRKYVNHPDIKDFYEQNILFPVRQKVIEYTNWDGVTPPLNIYIGCHQGIHKSVCLAEKLAIDMKHRCDSISVKHLTLKLEK